MCISKEHCVVMQARLKFLGVGKTVSQLPTTIQETTTSLYLPKISLLSHLYLGEQNSTVYIGEFKLETSDNYLNANNWEFQKPKLLLNHNMQYKISTSLLCHSDNITQLKTHTTSCVYTSLPDEPQQMENLVGL
ncbi:hypothetical protein V8G54_013361 [Vigna mungo]|uniref:Uncharacterized protein n=1 Tax=Vigna mungo TaxID=3915 RepID=A0AAQ3NT68_VIGMU